MLGLVIKDFYITKKYMKTIFMIVIFYSVFCTIYSNMPFLAGMIILSFSMIVLTTIAYDDAVKWDKYALSMPVSRKNIVFAKYVSTAIYTLSGSIITLVLTIIIQLIKKAQVTNEDLFTILAISTIGFVLVSVLLPLVYKFGLEKARLLLVLVFAIPFAVVLIAKSMNIAVPSERSIYNILIFSPFVALIIFVLSFYISSKIYENKEL